MISTLDSHGHSRKGGTPPPALDVGPRRFDSICPDANRATAI